MQRRCGTIFGLLVLLPAIVFRADVALADGATAYDPELRVLAEAVDQLKSKYVGSIDERRLVANAIRGMLQGLDPHSDYLDPDAYRQLKQENGGQFGGLGMEVRMEAGAVRVLAAYEDAPAYRAGLRPGDLITRLGGISVEGMTLDQAILRARGEPDTAIGLTYMRKGDAEPRNVTVRRALIESSTVKSALLGTGYAYARITSFNQRTAESLLAALAQASRQGGTGLKGVLLDLRDNPGGLLKAAVGVSSIFLLDESLVVYTEAAAAESRMRLLTSERQYLHTGATAYAEQLARLKTVPVVVLVNSGSASAAEIVAGAMQDQHRATIAGTQTFGKGSVQVLIPLSDGSALKLTTAHYLTPSGQRIQGKGVTPDTVIEQPRATRSEADGPTALEAPAGGTTCPVADLRNAADVGLPGGGIDCQLMRAFDLLRHLPVIARN